MFINELTAYLLGEWLYDLSKKTGHEQDYWVRVFEGTAIPSVSSLKQFCELYNGDFKKCLDLLEEFKKQAKEIKKNKDDTIN